MLIKMRVETSTGRYNPRENFALTQFSLEGACSNGGITEPRSFFENQLILDSAGIQGKHRRA